MQTFDQALFGHLKAGRISMEDGAAHGHPPARLQAARRRRRPQARTTMDDLEDLEGRTAAMSGNGQNVAPSAPLDGSGRARQIGGTLF